jgi:hypothetical protein
LTKHLIDSKDKPHTIANEGDTVEGSVLVYDEPDAINISEIHKLLKIAAKTYQDDDGWVNAATAGNYLKRARPEFDCKAFGYDKLFDLFRDYPKIYDTKKQQVGKGIVVSYKIK